jgi:hypothetical protein
MLSMVPTTFALIHGAACTMVAEWRPIELRTNDAPSGV